MASLLSSSSSNAAAVTAVLAEAADTERDVNGTISISRNSNAVELRMLGSAAWLSVELFVVVAAMAPAAVVVVPVVVDVDVVFVVMAPAGVIVDAAAGYGGVEESEDIFRMFD
jgi:hypothetical protein